MEQYSTEKIGKRKKLRGHYFFISVSNDLSKMVSNDENRRGTFSTNITNVIDQYAHNTGKDFRLSFIPAASRDSPPSFSLKASGQLTLHLLLPSNSPPSPRTPEGRRHQLLGVSPVAQEEVDLWRPVRLPGAHQLPTAYDEPTGSIQRSKTYVRR
jgi:hypothetical protein